MWTLRSKLTVSCFVFLFARVVRVYIVNPIVNYYFVVQCMHGCRFCRRTKNTKTINVRSHGWIRRGWQNETKEHCAQGLCMVMCAVWYCMLAVSMTVCEYVCMVWVDVQRNKTMLSLWVPFENWRSRMSFLQRYASAKPFLLANPGEIPRRKTATVLAQ